VTTWADVLWLGILTLAWLLLALLCLWVGLAIWERRRR